MRLTAMVAASLLCACGAPSTEPKTVELQAGRVARLHAAEHEPTPPRERRILFAKDVVARAPDPQGLDGAPRLALDTRTVVACTHGDNGMADFEEVVCQVAGVGQRSALHVPIVAYDDAVRLDHGDFGLDADMRERMADAAAAASEKVIAALGGGPRRALAEACSLDWHEVLDPSLGPLGCTVEGVVVSLGDGSLDVRQRSQLLFTERFPLRMVAGDPAPCGIEPDFVRVWRDEPTAILALVVEYRSHSDACPAPTEFELRVVQLAQ